MRDEHPDYRAANVADDLIDALKAMLVATDASVPDAFPGHSEAFLRMVAIPRAKEVYKAATGKDYKV